MLGLSIDLPYSSPVHKQISCPYAAGTAVPEELRDRVSEAGARAGGSQVTADVDPAVQPDPPAGRNPSLCAAFIALGSELTGQTRHALPWLQIDAPIKFTLSQHYPIWIYSF